MSGSAIIDVTAYILELLNYTFMAFMFQTFDGNQFMAMFSW